MTLQRALVCVFLVMSLVLSGCRMPDLSFGKDLSAATNKDGPAPVLDLELEGHYAFGSVVRHSEMTLTIEARNPSSSSRTIRVLEYPVGFQSAVGTSFVIPPMETLSVRITGTWSRASGPVAETLRLSESRTPTDKEYHVQVRGVILPAPARLHLEVPELALTSVSRGALVEFPKELFNRTQTDRIYSLKLSNTGDEPLQLQGLRCKKRFFEENKDLPDWIDATKVNEVRRGCELLVARKVPLESLAPGQSATVELVSSFPTLAENDYLFQTSAGDFPFRVRVSREAKVGEGDRVEAVIRRIPTGTDPFGNRVAEPFARLGDGSELRFPFSALRGKFYSQMQVVTIGVRASTGTLCRNLRICGQNLIRSIEAPEGLVVDRLRMKNLEFADSAVAASEGNYAEIAIAITAEKVGDFSGVIRVHTSDPSRPILEIPVRWSVIEATEGAYIADLSRTKFTHNLCPASICGFGVSGVGAMGLALAPNVFLVLHTSDAWGFVASPPITYTARCEGASRSIRSPSGVNVIVYERIRSPLVNLLNLSQVREVSLGVAELGPGFCIAAEREDDPLASIRSGSTPYWAGRVLQTARWVSTADTRSVTRDGDPEPRNARCSHSLGELRVDRPGYIASTNLLSYAQTVDYLGSWSCNDQRGIDRTVCLSEPGRDPSTTIRYLTVHTDLNVNYPGRRPLASGRCATAELVAPNGARVSSKYWVFD